MKSFLAGILAAAALSATACGPSAPANEPVVAVAPADSASPAGTSTPADAAAKSHEADVARKLAGVWEDMETHVRHTVTVTANKPTVASIVDTTDGEVYKITNVKWDAGVLAWTYHVPSTGYDVSITTEQVDGDTLWGAWSNGSGSGRQEFRRYNGK